MDSPSSGWILRQQSFFAQFLPPPTAKRYSPGETFWYLGRQYRLKVEDGQPQV
jgi:predicted metal-dependent hydrolase